MAIDDGFNNIIDSATLMHYYGHTLYTVLGKFENIKITTPSDFYIFRALFEARENSQIFGI
jgi:2-C-methyl-D-erythritol 4-phosphate cytidylyltransferase